MFSQTNLTTRRQFLERSAWGFGSAFLLPSLLQSCMQDHVIPDPTKPPTNPPALFDAEIDWNDDAKTAVTTALGMIPEAGEILSGLVDIFWPKSGEDVWGKVKTQVENLVQQDIAAYVYTNVSGKLGDLKRAVTEYLNELIAYQKSVTDYENDKKDPTKVPVVPTYSGVLGQWITTRTAFSTSQSSFQEQGYELPLLGLFAQYANMYLGLLRDVVAFGETWGRTKYEHEQDIQDLKSLIADFTAYPNLLHKQHQDYLKGRTKPNNALCEPFKTVNAYVRDMTFMVLDFRDMWPYFDVTLYPNGSTALLTREIYSDPYGSCDDSGDIVITTPVPTQRPTQLTVWGYDRIDAVQLTYPANSGPGGLTTTPRMGNLNGGSTQPPHGGIITNTPNNPIIAASVYYAMFKYNSYASNPLVAQLQFLFDDRTTTDVMGGTAGSINGVSNTDWIGYPYEALSSIHINGVNKVLGTADSIVLGFTFWKSPAAQVNALRDLYVTSPKERSVSDFAQAYPSLAIPAGLITDDLKAARKAYWENLKAQAKGPK